MLDTLAIHNERERVGRQGFLRYALEFERYLIRAHHPDIVGTDNCHVSASRRLSEVGVTATNIPTTTRDVAHPGGAMCLVDAVERRFTNRRIQSYVASRRARERGELPLLELLDTVPRKAARCLRRVYIDRADRDRATLTVIAEVFLALADLQPEATADLEGPLALMAAQRIETNERRHRRRVTGKGEDLAGVACDPETDARRDHQADLSGWWQLVLERLRPDQVAVLKLRFDRLPGFGTSQDGSIDDGHAAMSALRVRRS